MAKTSKILRAFAAAFALAVSCCLSVVGASPGTGSNQDFSGFWQQFKTAVVASDKPAVADLTSFPFSNYTSRIKDRAEFLRRYDRIFNGEANAAQCFSKAKPAKENARAYAVYCPFKGTPNDRENTPIRFSFELGKAGWRFAGLDNINE